MMKPSIGPSTAYKYKSMKALSGASDDDVKNAEILFPQDFDGGWTGIMSQLDKQGAWCTVTNDDLNPCNQRSLHAIAHTMGFKIRTIDHPFWVGKLVWRIN